MAESQGKWQVEAAAASDVGLVRARNEDGAWLADGFLRSGSRAVSLDSETVREGVFLAVADGVGGAVAGDYASRFVLERLAGFRFKPPGSVEEWLRGAADEVHDALVRSGFLREDRRGTATTLTGVYVRGAAFRWFNAGDSRLYALDGGSLIQVSRDHTLREMRGDMSIPGNIITNCFGITGDFYLDVGTLDAASGGGFLLCSDGLSDYAEHRTLEGIMNGCMPIPGPPALEAAAQEMVAAAKSGGGGDNITCLIFRVSPH